MTTPYDNMYRSAMFAYDFTFSFEHFQDLGLTAGMYPNEHPQILQMLASFEELVIPLMLPPARRFLDA